MADSPTPNATTEPNSGTPELGKQAPQSNSNQPDPSPPSSSSAPSSSVPANPNPTTPLPPPIISQSQPPSIPTIPPSAPPSFRPVAPPVPGPAAPQFSPLLNPNLQSLNYQNPNVQPPGVSPVTVTISGAASGGVTAAMSVPPMMAAYAPLGQHPNPDLRPYMPMPNGFPTMAVPAPQGMIPPSVSQLIPMRRVGRIHIAVL